jgi:hypothetical protein
VETGRLRHQGTIVPPDIGQLGGLLPQTSFPESSTRPACMTTDWPDVVLSYPQAPTIGSIEFRSFVFGQSLAGTGRDPGAHKGDISFGAAATRFFRGVVPGLVLMILSLSRVPPPVVRKTTVAGWPLFFSMCSPFCRFARLDAESSGFPADHRSDGCECTICAQDRGGNRTGNSAGIR